VERTEQQVSALTAALKRSAQVLESYR